MAKKKNPLVFMDVCIDGDPAEKMVFELFFDRAPKTADNFRALCTGEKGIGPKSGKPLHFKGSFFHRILKGYYAQGGDFVKRDGTGGESIYSEEEFPDELSKLKHNERGLLSMPVTLRDSLGSQFIITFEANHSLDRKHVIFGKLTHGWGVLKRIENAGDIDGNPTVTVKVINCGEYSEDVNSHEMKRKGKHKKSSKDRRKRRRRRYEYDSSTSESDSDSESESSESDSAESDVSSSSYGSSSSDDDKLKKRKRSYKRDKYKRAKRRDKGRDKKRRRRDKRSKIRSRRASDSLTNTEGDSNPEDGGLNTERKDEKSKKELSQKAVDGEASSIHHKRRDQEIVLEKENAFPKENGEQRTNGLRTDAKCDKTTDRQPDIVDDHPGKSRSRSLSPRRILSKNMSISPRRSPIESPSVSPKSLSSSVSRSPPRAPQRSNSFSRSPVKSDSSRSPARSVSRSPVKSWRGRSAVKSRSQRTNSNSPASLPGRSISPSPPRKVSKKSMSRSPVRVSRSRSPARSSRRSASRSSGRVANRKNISRSPIRPVGGNNRRSYSRSRSPVRRVRSPPSDRDRSLSRSVSPDGSPKRIRRGRGFSQRYSYARRYRTPSLSPVRSYRYGGRSDRDRYSSYRRYSPRRYRSPPRARTPPRYRSRRTRSPVSRSPRRNRRYSRSRSPIRSRSPVRSRSRSPVEVAARVEKRRSPSRSRSPSASRSSDSLSPRLAGKNKSRSSSESPNGKTGLVSYGNGPDSE